MFCYVWLASDVVIIYSMWSNSTSSSSNTLCLRIVSHYTRHVKYLFTYLLYLLNNNDINIHVAFIYSVLSDDLRAAVKLSDFATNNKFKLMKKKNLDL